MQNKTTIKIDFLTFANTESSNMTFIPNEHISLRALEKGDLNYLYHIENLEEAREYGDNLTPISKEDIKALILNANKDIYTTKQLRLIIEHNETCQAIGIIDLFDFSPLHQKAGVGIWINKDYRHQGYALEALNTLSSYAFETLAMNQLYCHIATDNLGSIKLFEKADYVNKGMLSQWIKTSQGFKDTFILQRLRVLK